jgi:hypothetical protein
MFPEKKLAAAYRHHNFQPVAILQNMLGKLAARHNFAVAFHRDALVAELHMLDQRRNTERGVELLHCAVDGESDHFRNCRVEIKSVF